ncbi:MAG: M28 family peptidase [Gemmatimonadota bacterium]
MRALPLALASTLLAVAPLGAQEPASVITEDLILGHTLALSDDSLGGRGPGSPGEEIAQRYLIQQMESAGLEPGGVDGAWLQPFDLIRITSAMPESLRVSGDGDALGLAYGTDWVAAAGRQTPRTAIADAEIVFVGYGIVAPEEEWDDYKDADVAGKILLFLNNDPAGDRFAGDTRLYYGRWTYKYEIAAEKGAAGALIVHTAPSAGYPWQVVQSSFGGTEFELPAPPDEPRIGVRGWLTHEAASRLAELAGHDLDALEAAAQGPDFRPVPLGVNLDLAFTTDLDTTPTANVIGQLPGSDPELRDTAVLYTAHYDHLGIGRPVEGDSIYNGARDNALGTATMLAIARAFAELPEPPLRTVLFAAVGAEEQGLLGSEHLALHPPIPACRLVANLNLDGGSILGRSEDVRQIGRGKSDLDALLDRFASEQGRTVLPEEFPDRGYFYRSDQFNLAKVGVPALYLHTGVDIRGHPEGWGVAREEEWVGTLYHQPSDEVTPEWDLAGLVEDARLLFQLGRAVAASRAAPAWRPGDEFASIRAGCEGSAATSDTR